MPRPAFDHAKTEFTREDDLAWHGGASNFQPMPKTIGEAWMGVKLGVLTDHQYNLGNREPNIQVWHVVHHQDRSLTPRHTRYHRRPLRPDSTWEMLKRLR